MGKEKKGKKERNIEIYLYKKTKNETKEKIN